MILYPSACAARRSVAYLTVANLALVSARTSSLLGAPAAGAARGRARGRRGRVRGDPCAADEAAGERATATTSDRSSAGRAVQPVVSSGRPPFRRMHAAHRRRRPLDRPLDRAGAAAKKRLTRRLTGRRRPVVALCRTAPPAEYRGTGGGDMGLEISLLGRPNVRRDGVTVAPPRGHKVWGLLAYLVLNDQPVARTRAAALLFPDANDPLATVRWNLHELRRLLGPDCGLRGDPIRLRLPPASVLDVAVLRSRVVASGAAHRRPGRRAAAGAELPRLCRVRGVAGRGAPAPAQCRRGGHARIRPGPAGGRADRRGGGDGGPAGRLEPVSRRAAGAVRPLPARRRRPGRRPPAAAGGDRPPPAGPRRGTGPRSVDACASSPVDDGAGADAAQIKAWSNLGLAWVYAGSYDAGLASMRRAVTAARRRKDPALLLRALRILGYGLGISSLGGGAESRDRAARGDGARRRTRRRPRSSASPSSSTR